MELIVHLVGCRGCAAAAAAAVNLMRKHLFLLLPMLLRSSNDSPQGAIVGRVDCAYRN